MQNLLAHKANNNLPKMLDISISKIFKFRKKKDMVIEVQHLYFKWSSLSNNVLLSYFILVFVFK